jgi:hypothetical protein
MKKLTLVVSTLFVLQASTISHASLSDYLPDWQKVGNEFLEGTKDGLKAYGLTKAIDVMDRITNNMTFAPIEPYNSNSSRFLIGSAVITKCNPKEYFNKPYSELVVRVIGTGLTLSFATILIMILNYATNTHSTTPYILRTNDTTENESLINTINKNLAKLEIKR